MKKYLMLALAASLFNVVFVTNLNCEHCKKKIEENVSFEKGVKDMKTDVEKKTVTIVYDAKKTSTVKLIDAMGKLGYKAELIKDKLL